MPPTYPNFSKQGLKSLHSLSRDKNLTIKKVDKGNFIVVKDTTPTTLVMGFHTYKVLLYRWLLGDPPEHMSENTGRFIYDLYSQNYIDKHTYSFLKTQNTPRAQRLYFLKKIPPASDL